MKNNVTSLRPLSGSTPVNLFAQIAKPVTESIARMPPSGSAPAKRFLYMWKNVTSLRPLLGSIP
eukprot:2641588-Amphidinium_carterae.1